MITQITKIESIATTTATRAHGEHGVTNDNFLPSIVLGLFDALGVAGAQNFASRFESGDYSYCASVLADLCVTHSIGFWAFYFFCDERSKDACKVI